MASQSVNAAVFLLLAGSLVIPQPACAQPPVEKIVTYWNERQHDVDGVTFRVEGDVFRPNGYLTRSAKVDGTLVTLGSPPRDHSYQTRAEIRIDLEGGRVFRRVLEERYGAVDPAQPLEGTVLFPVDDTCLFNGKVYKRYLPLETNHPHGRSAKWKLTELSIAEKRITPVFRAEHTPLLLSLGFVRVGASYDLANLRTQLNPSDFKRVSDATIDGTRCVVLQTVVKGNRYHEYVVEEAEPYLIREMKRFNKDGQLYRSATINYQQTDAGYLPETWQTTKFSFQTGKAQTFDMRLTDFEINPEFTNDDFDVDPTSGTRTVDKRQPRESMRYVIGDEEVPEIPTEEYDLQQEARANRNWMYLIAATVAVVLIGGAVWYRRARA